MELIRGVTYITDRSDLAMTIVKVYHISDKGYIKFKGILSNKNCGYVYETKNYKINSNIPELFGWRKK